MLAGQFNSTSLILKNLKKQLEINNFYKAYKQLHFY